ncbi:Oidioi.mRNA.OKI2018_I69.chr1.g1197.t1.cds [Oikopleura dioica]|uniref:Oidioi.mRNA.OKI2018_I69.chr1.g1197.t1.cds n=1 Tax=Oikopleura dioica TaxID=34765 RepID=A0ABN7SNW4_OIKDI|nr:Oidioi.mRNA.OKI2018_I69.chr1.g1197.t1.cds [Oikopleura dioica]
MQLFHHGQTLLTVLEIFLCCGTIFGWPNLIKIYKEEGFYWTDSSTETGNISVAITEAPEEQAKEDEKSAQEIQDAAFTAIFTLAMTFFAVAAFLAGFLMDSFGSMKTRLVGLVLFLAGSPLRADYKTVPAYKSLCSTPESGTDENKNNVELDGVEKNPHSEEKKNGAEENEKEVPAFFSSEVALSPLFISTMLFFIIQVTRVWGAKRDRGNGTTAPSRAPFCPVSGPGRDGAPAYFAPFCPVTRGQNGTGHRYSLPRFAPQTRVYFYLGAIAPGTQELVQLDQNCTQEEAGSITGTMMTNFAIFQFGGAGYAFLTGMVVDSTLAKTGDKNKALATGVFLTTIFGISFTALTLIANTTLQYASFFLSVLHKSFTYGINATVIGLSFPNEHFGKLYGTTQIFTIISAQATDWLFSYANANSFVKANRILLYLEIFSLFHFCLFLYLIRKNPS